MNESLLRHNSKFNFSPSFTPSILCSPLSLSFPPLKHPLQASYPRHILGGEAPSSMAYSLVDGASSHLFSFVFHCISMVENHHWRTLLKLKDPASIEAPQASFHQVVSEHKSFKYVLFKPPLIFNFTFSSIVVSSFFSMYFLTCLVLNVINMIL